MGFHYEAAELAAIADGYEPKLAYDENDSACRAILEHFEWDTASTVGV